MPSVVGYVGDGRTWTLRALFRGVSARRDRDAGTAPVRVRPDVRTGRGVAVCGAPTCPAVACGARIIWGMGETRAAQWCVPCRAWRRCGCGCVAPRGVTRVAVPAGNPSSQGARVFLAVWRGHVRTFVRTASCCSHPDVGLTRRGAQSVSHAPEWRNVECQCLRVFTFGNGLACDV